MTRIIPPIESMRPAAQPASDFHRPQIGPEQFAHVLREAGRQQQAGPGVRLPRCVACGEKFTSPDKLAAHRQTEHGVPGPASDDPVCAGCGAAVPGARPWMKFCSAACLVAHCEAGHGVGPG